ncbi:lipid A biosynthesis acyltransferase [Candidatus Pelagibacter sp.]|jgi:Kdo2-lipid IVA lauroyltransferase/acyltransferase|nr:lipid A biosynthesis acyltransferase [Candidatus Pelagibacter sp.]
MKNIKYFIQYILIISLLLFFKIIGHKYALIISSKLFSFFGPLFRSKKIIYSNLSNAFPNLSEFEKNKITKSMWCNYGKILAEYVFIKNFRDTKLKQNVIVKGQEILEKIQINKKPVIFISGHFNNFELMAMHIDKSGIDLAAIYRPLNNKYLNKIMEKIRRSYICSKQVKKGIAGTKLLLKYFRKGTSIALMIDQRVSQGIKSNFFNKQASTTSIPAQFIKKFKCDVVPIYIERINNINFKITINKPIKFSDSSSVEIITNDLNKVLQEMIIKNPDQWIWTHDRWK